MVRSSVVHQPSEGGPAPTAGRIAAVCVVHEIRPEPTSRPGRTAIDKRPVVGPVRVGRLGLEGDVQVDRRHHGGPGQAVYAYAREDSAWWERELGRPVPPGWFGENLAVEGLDVTGAVVGERWRIGAERSDALVIEATMPRTPCLTFARWVAAPGWIRRFAASGRVGTYFRVVAEGTVRAGDAVEVVRRPTHGVTVATVFRHLDARSATALLAAHGSGDVELADKVLHKAQRASRAPADLFSDGSDGVGRGRSIS